MDGFVLWASGAPYTVDLHARWGVAPAGTWFAAPQKMHQHAPHPALPAGLDLHGAWPVLDLHATLPASPAGPDLHDACLVAPCSMVCVPHRLA